MKRHLQIVFELNKIKITVAVAITTIAGYILASEKIDLGIVLPTVGIFLLACGSSVLNHLQEYKTDLLMQRTKFRPLPSGKVSVYYAVSLAVTQILTGSAILYFASGLSAFLLGFLALIWYNVIYTYLKKVTAFAVVPGSIIGAIPPLVGWVAAGGSLMDSKAWAMALFFFIWQIPHFWLLMLKFADDYKKAGFPTLSQKYSDTQIRKQILFLIVLTSIAVLLLPYLEVIKSRVASYGLIILSVLLIYIFTRIVVNMKETFSVGKHFRIINYYVLFIVLFICIDHLLF